MRASTEPEVETAAQAYNLLLEALPQGEPPEALKAQLSEWLGVATAQLPALLGRLPLHLRQSRDCAALLPWQETLSGLGCTARIEPVWAFRDWTLPEEALRQFQDEEGGLRAGVFIMLYIKPEPGMSRLRQIAAAVSAASLYCLNDAQMLVRFEIDRAHGAGRPLAELQDELHLAVSRICKDGHRLVLAAMALAPQEAEGPEQLLDLLATRLVREPGHDSQNADEDEGWKILLARPLAGRSWARVVEHGVSDQDRSALSAEQLAELKRHWPLGKDFDAGFQPNRSASQSVVRAMGVFQSGHLARIDRCWALVHDSQEWSSLPSLPDIALEIYQMTQDEDVDAAQLEARVGADPAMSARILALVNSSYYGLQQKIDSLRHALVILGTEELAQLSLLVSSQSVFKGLGAEFGQRLWRHSASTAEIARALALRMNWSKPSALYAAALLHDVGKILLYASRSKDMAELERIARANGLPLHEMEREHFGHDHATLGAQVLRRWGLPEHLCQRVADHHGPAPGQETISESAALIGIADHLAHRLIRSESWADGMRLRRVHAQCLVGALGPLDLDKINALLNPGEVRLRSQAL